jgi:hypothetical protein
MARPDDLTVMGQQPPGITASSCPYCQSHDALAASSQGNPEALAGVQQLRREHRRLPGACVDPLRGVTW